MSNVIKCPYCNEENTPFDNEQTEILQTTIRCEECDEKFYLSREIEPVYVTWERD